MKTLLTVLILVTTMFESDAQKYALKAGAYFNADITDHKLGKITYPSFEASVERTLGNKFSINCSFNYAKREYEFSGYGDGFHVFYYNPVTYINYDQSLILEGRYYLKSNKTGLFIQAGIPFTYTIEKTYSYIPLPGETPQYVYSYAISTFGGIGIKYPFNDRFGVEMNMTISPSLNFLDEDYGTSGFIKSGLKLFYSFGKVKTKEK